MHTHTHKHVHTYTQAYTQTHTQTAKKKKKRKKKRKSPAQKSHHAATNLYDAKKPGPPFFWLLAKMTLTLLPLDCHVRFDHVPQKTSFVPNSSSYTWIEYIKILDRVTHRASLKTDRQTTKKTTQNYICFISSSGTRAQWASLARAQDYIQKMPLCKRI